MIHVLILFYKQNYIWFLCIFFQPSDQESDEDSLPPPPPPASPPPPPFTAAIRTPYMSQPSPVIHNTWQNQNNSSFNAYQYTDSEAESSHYALSLNGGQIIMNNTAGSRAPLPGFSSFVWYWENCCCCCIQCLHTEIFQGVVIYAFSLSLVQVVFRRFQVFMVVQN